MVAACGHAPTPPEPVSSSAEPAPRIVLDAALPPADVPADAARELDAALVAARPAMTCASGIGVVARVIRIEIVQATTVVTIGAGANQGVTTSWVVTLVPGELPMRIIRVRPTMTIAELTATPDQVVASAYAELCAP